jgi:hypothetical protein
LTFNGAFGQNLGAYGVEISNPFLWRQASVPGLQDVLVPTVVDIFYPKHIEIVDTTGTGENYWELKHGTARQMCVILNIQPIEWLAFEGGYGRIVAEHDEPGLDSTWENTNAYYGGVRCKVADILEINPEFGQYIYGHEPGFGRITYWGVEFAIVF